jgi:endonuclease G
MAPQNGHLDQHDWQYLEASLRALAEQVGELYVITGPIYVSSASPRLKGRVAIPDYTYKAIYDPEGKRAIAFVVTNRPDYVC